MTKANGDGRAPKITRRSMVGTVLVKSEEMVTYLDGKVIAKPIRAGGGGASSYPHWGEHAVLCGCV